MKMKASSGTDSLIDFAQSRRFSTGVSAKSYIPLRNAINNSPSWVRVTFQ